MFSIFFIFLLGNDLDSIRALFSEKEKELSLAVAKVEALTKQLEDIRRDRRGPLNLITGSGTAAASALNATNSVLTSNGLSINTTNNVGSNSNNGTSAARELDKLRRELMVSWNVNCVLDTLKISCESVFNVIRMPINSNQSNFSHSGIFH